jgi:hypothetical protein
VFRELEESIKRYEEEEKRRRESEQQWAAAQAAKAVHAPAQQPEPKPQPATVLTAPVTREPEFTKLPDVVGYKHGDLIRVIGRPYVLWDRGGVCRWMTPAEFGEFEESTKRIAEVLRSR